MTFYCSWMTVYCSWVDHFECVEMRIDVWQNKYFDHFEKWEWPNGQNMCKQTSPKLMSINSTMLSSLLVLIFSHYPSKP